MPEIKIVSWNCRGAVNSVFVCEMREIIRLYKPSVIILLEPRVSGATADSVCKRLGMKRWVRSEASGFSSGVWVCWDDDQISL